MSDVDGESAGGFGWFCAAVGSWFGAFGMQGLLFAWLVVGELRASPEWVGIAQTSTTAPQLLLLLVGGVVADRAEPRRLLSAMHVAACVPSLALAATIASGNLTLGSVIGYGVALGAVNAFLMPARDALLSRVAGASLAHAVATMTVVQFATQTGGTLVAGSAELIGAVTLLAIQSGILLSGCGFARMLPAPGGARPPSDHRGVGRLTAGVRDVVRIPGLRVTAVLVLCVGLFFIGPFFVLFPLLVRDVHHGGSLELSIVLMLFPVGTIAGSLLLRARGGFERRVRAVMLALLTGAAILGSIALGPSWPGFVALTLCWGLAGSVFINVSRTVFQELAPVESRARVLSVYQFALMSGAPIGSLASGFASGWLGPENAIFLFAGSMFAAVAGVWAFTDAASIR